VNRRDIGKMTMDHDQIISKAWEALRMQLNYQPIGINLLPEKFTMSALQKLYETILGKNLDRRNFQRKIHSFHILDKLEERKSGCAHRAPYLYQFNKIKYHKALNEGLSGGW
jgi:8-oxo-dGTP diphosphatase